VKKIGRRQWKKESGYHRRGILENAGLRYMSIIGDRLRARHAEGQKTEGLMTCNVPNEMGELARAPYVRTLGNRTTTDSEADSPGA